MRLICKIVFMSWLCVVLICGGNLLAQEAAVKQNAASAGKAKIVFPEVEGWKMGKIFEYPDEERGYSISYESDKGGNVTIYVYNNGLTNIPNDIADNVLTDEFSTAKDELFELQKSGYFRDVKEIANDETTLGGEKGRINALHSAYNFTNKDQSMVYEIYLFPFQNNFVKIRAKRLNRDGGKQNEAVAKLLAELDALFSK